MQLDVRIAVFTQNPTLYERLEEPVRAMGIPLAQFSCNDRLDVLEQWSNGAHLIALFDGRQQPQGCLRWIKWLSEERSNVVSVWLDSELTQEHVADAMRAGARDLLIGEIKPGDIESLVKRLGFQSPAADSPSRVIAAMGAAGGSGVTTLVTNLAIEIAKKESVPVGILDLDPFLSGVGLLLNVRPDSTLFDLRHKAGELDASAVRRMTVNHRSGVSLLASQGWSMGELPIPELLVRRVVVLMQQLFPYVLIDVPRTHGPISKMVLDTTEAVILVGQYSMSAAAGLRNIRQFLESCDYPRHRILLAANSVSEPSGLSSKQWTQLMACEAFAKIPFEPAVINQAAADGTSVSEVSGRAAITKSIQKMAQDLCACLQRQPETNSLEPGTRSTHAKRRRVAVMST